MESSLIPINTGQGEFQLIAARWLGIGQGFDLIAIRPVNNGRFRPCGGPGDGGLAKERARSRHPGPGRQGVVALAEFELAVAEQKEHLAVIGPSLGEP